jgi:DNA-binding transcriptional ArsR family regulator
VIQIGGHIDHPAAAEIAKALGHPLRRDYLGALRDRRELSPSEFVRDSDEPLGNVAYRVKALYEAEVLEAGPTVRRRGSLEHRYSFTGRRAGAVKAVMDLLAST